MSAFICDHKTFSNIYSGLTIYGKSNSLDYDSVKRGAEEALGGRSEGEFINILYYLNIRAVNQRYGEEMPEQVSAAELNKMCRFNPHIRIYQFLKSLECLRYQMCEGDVPKTPTYKSLGKLIDAVCYSIAHSAPEYDAAKWG